jgi:hypothetical protein
MIKFFRKIRQNMLTENKFSKYLIYAIGEIVLVVVGILIALSINNWNESRKQADNLNYIYTAIIGDLKRDNQEVDLIIKEFLEKKITIDKILNGTQDRESYINCLQCQNLIIGFPDLSLQIRGNNLLNNYLSINNAEKDSINGKISNFYTKNILELGIDQSFLSQDCVGNYNHWKNNYDWWSDYINDIPNNDFIEYSLNSQDYKNRLGTFKYVAFGLYIPKLELFKKESLDLILDLEGKIK